MCIFFEHYYRKTFEGCIFQPVDGALVETFQWVIGKLLTMGYQGLKQKFRAKIIAQAF